MKFYTRNDISMDKGTKTFIVVDVPETNCLVLKESLKLIVSTAEAVAIKLCLDHATSRAFLVEFIIPRIAP